VRAIANTASAERVWIRAANAWACRSCSGVKSFAVIEDPPGGKFLPSL